MKTKVSIRWVLLCSLLLVVLVPAHSAYASNGSAVAGILSGFFSLFGFGVALAVYIYVCMALMTIAEKTNTENAWMAWIPFINVFLMLSIAKKPGWWFILYLIPIVGFIINIIVWMGISQRCGKNEWLGLLWVIPPLGALFLPGYLAWAD